MTMRIKVKRVKTRAHRTPKNVDANFAKGREWDLENPGDAHALMALAGWRGLAQGLLGTAKANW